MEWAENILATAAGNALENAVKFFAGWMIQILTEILNFVGTWWLKIGAPSMGEGSATERIRSSTVVFVGMAGVIGTAFALIKVARDQDRNSTENLVMGIVRTILVTAIAVPMVALLFAATDELAPWLVRTISGSAQEDGLGQAMGLEAIRGGAMTLQLAGVILVIIPLALLGAVLNALIVIFSYGMAIALCGVLPIFAAASQTERGRKSFDKAVAWLAAVVLFKPAAAILYGAGLALLKGINGTAEDELGNTMIGLITGLVVILSASVAMPALAKVLVPAVSSGPTGMGASGLAMLGGALAIGAVTAGVGAAGVAAASTAGTAGAGTAGTAATEVAGTAGTAGTTGAALTDGTSGAPALTGGTGTAGPGGAGPGGGTGSGGSSGGPGGAGPGGGMGTNGGDGTSGGTGAGGGAGSTGADGGTGSGGSSGSTGGPGPGGPTGAEQQAQRSGAPGTTETGADNGTGNDTGGAGSSGATGGGAGGPSGAQQQAPTPGAPAETKGNSGADSGDTRPGGGGGAGGPAGAEPSNGSGGRPNTPASSGDEAAGRPQTPTGADGQSPTAQGYWDGAPGGAEKTSDKSGLNRQRLEYALRDAARDAEHSVESGNDV